MFLDLKGILELFLTRGVGENSSKHDSKMRYVRKKCGVKKWRRKERLYMFGFSQRQVH